MKSMFMNYFKDGKLYQWDVSKETYLISDTNINGEFCLDQTNMNTLLKFENPILTLKDGLLKIQSGKIKANLKLSDEKLVIPNLEFEETLKLNVDKIKIASKFVDKNISKFILSGVHIGKDGIYATNNYSGYRYVCENNCSLILSNSFVKMLMNLSGELEFKCNKNIIACEYQGELYVGRLIEGAYPNVTGMYSISKYPKEVVINKQELKDFLDYETNKNSFVILDNNKITINEIATNNNYIFETEIELPIDEKICLSYEKLINVINSIEDEEIRIKYSEGKKPLLFNNEFILLPCVIADDEKTEEGEE